MTFRTREEAVKWLKQRKFFQINNIIWLHMGTNHRAYLWKGISYYIEIVPLYDIMETEDYERVYA